MSLGTILLVEDETAVLALNRRHLEAAGYRVLTARTIKEARAAVWERPPDLMILDVLLPDGSGYDFCVEFRKTSTAPVLFLTCMGQDVNIIQGLGSGGDDYLAKPYSMEVLLARVAAILRRSGHHGGVIELPPLSIDLQTGRVLLSGELIPLSPKETQLLAFLTIHAGREFSAGELYRAVWGEDGGISVGTVKAHISKLRAKLHLDEGSPFELSLTPEKKYLFLKVRFGSEG
jgi:DNA-binding response OmpR family regulator